MHQGLKLSKRFNVRGLRARNTALRLGGILLTLVCLGFLGYIIYRERDVLTNHLMRADSRQLLVVAGWYLLDLLLFAGVWGSMLTSLGGHAGLREHIRVYTVANAAKRLPGTLWYIAGRAALYARSGIPARTVATGAAVEAVLTWIAGLAIALPFLAVSLSGKATYWSIAGAVLLLLVLNPFSVRWVLNRLATTREIAVKIPLARIYLWLFLDIVGWALGGVMLSALIRVFAPLSISQIPEVIGSWAVAGTASMLTILLPSGFGVTEVTLTALLSRVVSPDLAVLTAVSARVLVTVFDVAAGGLAHLLLRPLEAD